MTPEEMLAFIGILFIPTSAVFAYAGYLRARRKVVRRKAVAPKIRKRQVSVVSRIDGAKRCSICLGVIKRDLGSLDCTCGGNFHHSCARRVGKCPLCGRELRPANAESNDPDAGRFEPVRATPLSKEDSLFLLEDRLLLGEIDGETYSRLKAEITSDVHPGEKRGRVERPCRACPECGSALETSDKFCRSCGLVLSEDFNGELFQCSACGRVVTSEERLCSCGAVLFDPGDAMCPECGYPVRPDVAVCPKCGRVRIIEVLECPSCGREVNPDDFECECGAIFEDMIERIECPECSAPVGLEDGFCRNCGVQFKKDGYSRYKVGR